MNKLTAQTKSDLAQKGIVFLPVIIAAGILLTIGYVGVQQGYIPFISAPSTRWAIFGPYDRSPEKLTPSPSPRDSQKISFANDIVKAKLEPRVATGKKDGWNVYSSSQYGYTVSYPLDWELFDGNTETSRQIQLKHNGNLAYIDIQAFFDKTLSEPDKVQQAMDALEEKFRNDSRLKVNSFKSDIQGNIGGYISTGEQTVGEENYNFENRGLLATSGKILLFHGAYKKTAPSDYLQKIEKIMTSFQTD